MKKNARTTVTPHDGPSGPSSLRLSLLGRAAGGLWFLVLAAVYGRGLIDLLRAIPLGGGAFAVWAPVISRGCTVAFCLTLAWLMMARGQAVARRAGLAPGVIAILGTYGVWAIALLPGAALTPALDALSAAITLTGSLLIVFVVLYLGRSFSIAPQARQLVTRGPYGLVRHPLYAAEELAILGVGIHVVWWAAVPFLTAHVAVQLCRMNYEEALLRSVFPDYGTYARRTARWIPGIW